MDLKSQAWDLHSVKALPGASSVSLDSELLSEDYSEPYLSAYLGKLMTLFKGKRSTINHCECVLGNYE